MKGASYRTVAVLALVVASMSAHARDKTVYGWECKTQSGEVVLKGMQSIPYKVGEVVESATDPVGKGTGIKNAGVCSQVRFDLADGRTGICEPIGIPTVHAFNGGWQYKTVDKSKCK
jgi:hypothetical protein